MKKGNLKPENAARLRQKAEEKLKERKDKARLVSDASDADKLKLIHELEVHKVELEMQNDELLAVKEKAEQSEKKYTDLYDFAPSGYLSLTKEGEILNLNFAAAKMLGKERSKLINNRFPVFLSKNTRPGFNQFLEKAFTGIEKQTCEAIIETKDNSKPEGHSLPIYVTIEGIVNQDGKLCHLTVVDISKRKQAEQELIAAKEKAEESEAKFRSLYNRVADAIFIYDPETLELIEANEATSKMYGYKSDELIGMSILKFSAEVEKSKLAATNIAQKGEVDVKLRHHKKKDGTDLFVELQGYKIVVNNKPLTFAVCHDITESVKSEQELQAANQQLNANNQQLIASEQELKNEKIFSEKIVETANAIIVGLDKDHIIRIFNRGAEQITGYKKEEVIGKDWFKTFFPKEMLDEINKVWKDAWGVKSHSYINPILAKSGEERIISWQTTGMYDNDDVSKHLLLSIGEDITDRKQAEKDLKEKQALLMAIYRNAPLVLMVVDSDRRIQQVNSFASQFAGRNIEEMLGLRGGEALRCLHALDDPKGCGFGEFCNQCAIRNTVLDTLETGDTHLQEEAPYYFRENEDKIQEMTFLASTTPITVKDKQMALVTLQDITQRKQAEQAVQKNGEKIATQNQTLNETNKKLIAAKEKAEKSKKNLRFLFDNMTQGVVYHKPTGEVIQANEAAPKILGLSLAQLYGKTSLDPRWKSIHEDGTPYPGETHPAMVTIKTKKPVKNSIMGVFIPEKNVYSWININSVPQFNDKNELLQVVVTFEDVTEIKKNEKALLDREKREKQIVEDELKKIKESLVRTTRLAAIGQVSASIAHDLRNPLGAVRNAAYFLRRKVKLDNEKLETHFNIIDKEMDTADKIISNLLQLARAKHPEKKKTELKLLIDEVKNRYLNDSEISIHFSLSPKFYEINCDRSQMMQVFRNLLENAIQAKNKIVNIFIDARIRNNQNFIIFRDDGEGIDKKIQKIIFEPLLTTKAKGTGLGLTICKQIIEKHDGSIKLLDHPEGGACFEIKLPLE